MLNISLKYCLEVKVSEWRNLVGVGIIQEEHLRYWLGKTNDNEIYVKFADTKEKIPFTFENKSIIIDAVKRVNTAFEENPEQYQLGYYKKKLEQQEKTKQLPINVPEQTDDIDTFNVDDEDTYQSTILEQSQETTTITYDNSIFSIQGVTLFKFYGKHNISEYTIPNGIEIIDKNAFADNKFLYVLNMPETVTSIDDCAFKNCSNLRELILPSSITHIGKNVFDNCDNLETLFCKTKAVKKLLKDLPKHIEIVCLEF